MQMPGGGSGSGSAREWERVQGAAAAPWCWGGGTAFFSSFCQGWGLGVHRGLGGFIDGQSSCGFPDGPGSYWG